MTPGLDPALAEVLGSVGGGMPVAHAGKLAGHLAGLSGPSAVGKHAAKLLIPAPAFTEACNRIWEAWKGSPDTPGVAIAVGVSSAAHAAAAARAGHSEALVVTGPSSWQVPTTSTSQAVRSVIDAAAATLLLASYASYRVPWLIDALDAAHARGVHIRMLLESAPGIDAAAAFADLAGKVTVLHWPLDARPVVGAKPAAMHAKAVIADRTVAFVTSANLTGSAMDHNLEVGILVRGGDLPDRLQRHFEQLEANGTLVSG
ncbi:MAG: DISARM system phospholipase D-like protein DrmC [Candidatus Nanopelagicales bacterium]